MAGLVRAPNATLPVAQGATPTNTEVALATTMRSQLIGDVFGQNAQSRLDDDVYEVFDSFLPTITSGDVTISDELVSRLNEADFRPDADLLADITAELDALGVEYPDDIRPENIEARRADSTGEARSQVAYYDEIISRGRGFGSLAAQLMGGFAAGIDDLSTYMTAPVGASSRMGVFATALAEGSLNAATELYDTPVRNRFLTTLGMPEESLGENMAAGFVFGSVLGGGLRLGTIGMERVTAIGATAYANRQSLRLAREAAATLVGAERPAVRAAAQAVLSDIREVEAAVTNIEPEAVAEHVARAQAAHEAVHSGTPLELPDRPGIAEPAPALLNGNLVEVDPRALLVQPDVFQFKTDLVQDGGVTSKLIGVQEWDDLRAGVVVVYEYADGRQAVADGHQRTALANRIMDADPSQNIRMAARIIREADGFTPEDARVLAALKNIAEAADGMTSRMALDAARVLRVSPQAIAELPAGPGIRRAQELARLSEEAFMMVINRAIPEDHAALIARLVNDQAMHAPLARLLERTAPETAQQADSIIRQALEAPTDRTKTVDLFGESEVLESLYVERAKVLERTLSMLREERSVFRSLVENESRIQGRGQNKLDGATNARVKKDLENTLAAVRTLAHRAGPISEALNNAATKYKETGRLADAARAVTDAVRGQIERVGLAGLTDGDAGRGAKPQSQGAVGADPNEGFGETDGPGIQEQIAANPINDAPREGFSDDLKGRQQIVDLVDNGASFEEIESHPVVKRALDAMASQEETINLPGYGSDAWHESRAYVIDGEPVVGTLEALPLWVDAAKREAFGDAYEPGSIRAEREATIIMGPPAAGKSTIAESIARGRGAAIVDADMIKVTMPEYNDGIGAAAVHEESSELGLLLEAAMAAEGANIVLPKVGSSQGSIEKAIARFRAAGYSVRLVNMYVTEGNAFRRAMRRFGTTGRLVPPDYIHGVGERPTEVYAALREAEVADGYVDIDNNGGLNDQKTIRSRSGQDPLEGSDLSIREGGGERAGQAKPGVAERAGPTPARRADETLTLNSYDAARADLLDRLPVGTDRAEDGTLSAATKTRQQISDDLDADDDAVEVLELCLK